MVTRFQVTSPDRPGALHQAHEANRVYGNAVKYQHRPDQVDHQGSVMATRQLSRGADTVRLDPNNEGSRTHISTAVRLGLVIETSKGYFQDAPKTAPVAPPAVPVRAAAPFVPATPSPAPASPPVASSGRMEHQPGFYDAPVPDFGF